MIKDQFLLFKQYYRYIIINIKTLVNKRKNEAMRTMFKSVGRGHNLIIFKKKKYFEIIIKIIYISFLNNDQRIMEYN